MKINTFALSILFLLFSCTDKPIEIDKSHEIGMFDGSIGRHLFVQVNSEQRTVITQKGSHENLDIEIKLDGSGGQGDQKFTIYNQLNMKLKDVSKNKTYQSFNQEIESNKATYNQIILLVKEQMSSSVKSNQYSCLPNKKIFTIKITDLGNNTEKYVKGSIDGYLFNIENPKDSILITAKFIAD